MIRSQKCVLEQNLGMFLGLLGPDWRNLVVNKTIFSQINAIDLKPVLVVKKSKSFIANPLSNELYIPPPQCQICDNALQKADEIKNFEPLEDLDMMQDCQEVITKCNDIV